MSPALAISLIAGSLLQQPATQDRSGRHHNNNNHHHHHGGRHDGKHGFRMEHRMPLFLDGFWGSPFRSYYFVDVVTSWDFFGPPMPFVPFAGAPFDPFGFGVAPLILWNEPIFVRPPFAMARPDVAPAVEPRGAVQIVPTVPARAATTDIPERVVEDLLGRRRPSLAQRAQAARLEAGGDTMFRAGHYVRAAERFQQALGFTPDNDEAQFKRAAALIGAGHYADALRALRDALRTRPDWPFVQHDLTAIFPDDAAIARVLDSLEREARRPDPEGDPEFLRAYIMYFSGQRAAAEAIFRNPPGNVVPPYYQVFQQAIERARQ
jgi:tetratricopeptide repeat protein